MTEVELLWRSSLLLPWSNSLKLPMCRGFLRLPTFFLGGGVGWERERERCK